MRCLTDSLLTVGQLKETFQVKDPLLTKYYQKVVTFISRFKNTMIEHIPRCKNAGANTLSKLLLGKGKGRFDTVVSILTILKDLMKPCKTCPASQSKQVEVCSRSCLSVSEYDWL